VNGLLNVLSLLTLVFAVVNVMFVQSEYTVNETTGFVTVCVEATGAELARDVNVRVFTASDSARGKFVLVN